MSEKFLGIATKIYLKFPILRPCLRFFGRIFFPVKVKFSGWGMETIHELPWNDEYSEVFRQTMVDIKKNFEFTRETTGTDRHNVDELLWRHWIVSFCVRYVLKFAVNDEINFVECGVGDGMTTFFALREIKGCKITKFSMHLYDAWGSMKKEDLLQSESSHAGKYVNLSIDITKRNLSEFTNNIIFHQGYVPDSFLTLPVAPKSIKYLHIDLNSAKPTLAALDFFFPRLERGGIILFDDYGWAPYTDTKKIIDKFLSDKPGILMKLPTGQAVYFH